MEIRTPTKKLKFGIILLPQFTLSALSLFLDCLRLAADEKDQSRQIRCSWDITTLSGSSVQSSTGMFVEPTAVLGSVLECEYVVVVGGLISPHKKASAALSGSAPEDQQAANPPYRTLHGYVCAGRSERAAGEPVLCQLASHRGVWRGVYGVFGGFDQPLSGQRQTLYLRRGNGLGVSWSGNRCHRIW